MLMKKCEKCGREKITASKAVTGFPGYVERGTRKSYCGYCDDPPEMILDVCIGPICLVPENSEAANA